MLKKAFAVVMVFILMVNIASASLILLDFCLYQKQIAAEKCENKKKPEMKCNGKCYLAKQLKKKEKKEKDSPIFPDFKKSPEVIQSFNGLELIVSLSPTDIPLFYKGHPYSWFLATPSLPPPEFHA